MLHPFHLILQHWDILTTFPFVPDLYLLHAQRGLMLKLLLETGDIGNITHNQLLSRKAPALCTMSLNKSARLV